MSITKEEADLIITEQNKNTEEILKAFKKQILGLLYKYESVYKRFPDLKDAMNEAERVLEENAELKRKNLKAKDLLKICYENYIYLEPLRSDIEQFLKEIEND